MPAWPGLGIQLCQIVSRLHVSGLNWELTSPRQCCMSNALQGPVTACNNAWSKCLSAGKTRVGTNRTGQCRPRLSDNCAIAMYAFPLDHYCTYLHDATGIPDRPLGKRTCFLHTSSPPPARDDKKKRRRKRDRPPYPSNPPSPPKRDSRKRKQDDDEPLLCCPIARGAKSKPSCKPTDASGLIPCVCLRYVSAGCDQHKSNRTTDYPELISDHRRSISVQRCPEVAPTQKPTHSSPRRKKAHLFGSHLPRRPRKDGQNKEHQTTTETTTSSSSARKRRYSANARDGILYLSLPDTRRDTT